MRAQTGLRRAARGRGMLRTLRRKHTKRLSDAELARRLEESGLIEQAVLDALVARGVDDGMLCEAIVELEAPASVDASLAFMRLNDRPCGSWATRSLSSPIIYIISWLWHQRHNR